MGHRDDQDKIDYSDEPVGVMAIRNVVGGTPFDIAVEIADDPAALAEVAAKMGIPPKMLRMQLRRILQGRGEEVIQEAVDNAEEAIKFVQMQQQAEFEGQSSATRKALAVNRLEACYTTLFSMGVRQEDWRAVKAAATVAVDIARVDGTLRERDTVEGELEKASRQIQDRKARQLGREVEGGIIEGAIVSRPAEVGHGNAEGAIAELGGACVVGGADGF